ncbi:hypothetical protein ACIRBX_07640 [Kitasatospora sp. NPDC096147]|uniref:hypothetical protein n=1 Tax=Kitasatospora sp. NPDC096147 TaxID=3364093 RepID=UPI003801F71E
MTDKPSDPHRLESPTEQLLRAALAARADQVTAQGLRPADPPTKRMRRIRPFHVVTTIAMFGLAASLVVGLLTTRTETVADANPAATLSQSPFPSLTPTDSPSPTDTPTPSPSPSATPTGDVLPGGEPSPSGAASATTSQPPSTPPPTFKDFQKIKVLVPAGWTVGKSDTNKLCLRTPDVPVTVGECLPNGVFITAWNVGDELNWPLEADADSDSGWAHQPICFAPEKAGTMPTAQRLIGAPERSLLKIGSRYVNKVRWRVACDATTQFTAQMWSFHKEQVFVNANGLPAKYQADLESIVAGLDVSGRSDPRHTTDVKVTFGESTVTQEGDTRVVTFPVTWANVSSTAYASIEPVVAGRQPADSDAMAKQPNGTLERKDGEQWKQLPMLRVGGGMDYASTGKDAAFPLAPGKSRTVTYRMKLTNVSDLQSIQMVGGAYLPTAGGEFKTVGSAGESPYVSIGLG